MSYKTINLSRNTYEKLVLYKHGNMTFDDVITEFMELVEEKMFYKYILEEHKKRMKKMKSGECLQTDTIEDALQQI